VAKPFAIALPPDHILSGAYTVRLTALDPATGAVVSGVNVSNVTMQVEQLAGGNLASGPFKFVPGAGA
jgi:hypothetical protein